jgi:hypothetical protein
MTIPASAFTLTAVYKDVGPAADTSLVGGYAFDEASGTAATDASGRGNAGTIGGATRTTGRNGSALSFNGTNNSVSIPDSTSLDLTSGMTLEAWVNPAAVTSWRTVILKETTGDLAYALYSASSYGGVAATRPSAWIGGGDIGATAALPANTWSHLATTWNGTTWKLYVDGVEKATKAFAGPIPVSAGPLKIGGNAIWSEWFSGRIDDVRIYNRGLTAAEVARDRDTPVGGASPPPPPDTTAPTVSVSAPTAGATVSGSNVAVSATAADNVGVSGVQLRVDGVSLGNEDTTAPYGATWDTTTVANGTHTLTAVARDAAGNSTTSAGVGVTVSNAPLPPPPGGLVAAYGFEEASGASVTDASGRGNVGTITGATRITTGKFGNALSFNGTSNSVLVPDSPSLRLTTGMTLEAWVYQAANTNYRTCSRRPRATSRTGSTAPRPTARPRSSARPRGSVPTTWGPPPR